jgi:hypothetical protein
MTVSESERWSRIERYQLKRKLRMGEVEITKAKDIDPAKSQIVNIESGGFGKAPRGSIDEDFDTASVSPGVNVFEKMISGAYLGPLCLKTAHVAARNGLFSRAAARKLRTVEETTTKDISDFLMLPETGDNPLAKALSGEREEDIVTLYYLVDALVERAALRRSISPPQPSNPARAEIPPGRSASSLRAARSISSGPSSTKCSVTSQSTSRTGRASTTISSTWTTPR